MYDCVIPAAGASRRMGEWKPGLPFRGGTMLSAAVRTARDAGCRVLVVAGNRADDVPAALGYSGADSEPLPAEILFNPVWISGMMGSVQVGMDGVRSERFFVLPADMPFVPVRAFLALAQEARTRAAEGLPDRPCFPTFRGRPGHPVLIPSSLIPRAARLPKESRFKDFLIEMAPVFVAVEHPGILGDVDTQDEYLRALDRDDREELA